MGLGQYFGAIVHFAWLMVALFICVGCFHLHEFRTNNNLSNKYLVVVHGSWWDWPEPVTVYTWCGNPTTLQKGDHLHHLQLGGNSV